MARRNDRRKREDISAERIEILFTLAEKEAVSGDLGQANYYVKSARDICTRTKTPIPGFLKRKFCGGCGHFLKPGVNCRTRLDSRHKRVEVTCGDCGRVSHYPYVREKKEEG
ncbi:MAG TPA: ribonuclease P [Candidatus Altiarchaeales archaeon]|nr:ribonuclease P [Candidatus Altiarchaeales archaeon]